MALDKENGIWTSGRSGKRGRAHTKGRQASDAALADVQALLGSRPRQRDLLIEFLHLIHKADKKYRSGRGKPKPTTPQLFRGPLSWVKGV